MSKNKTIAECYIYCYDRCLTVEVAEDCKDKTEKLMDQAYHNWVNDPAIMESDVCCEEYILQQLKANQINFTEIHNNAGSKGSTTKKYIVKTYYSWGEEEPDTYHISLDAAWEEAKEKAFAEAETTSLEHDSEIGLHFDNASYRITIHYLYDDTYCYIEIVKY